MGKEEQEELAAQGVSSPIEGEPRIMVDGERWFTYQQLGRVLRCTKASVFNHVRKGKVEKKQIDGITLYRLNGYM